MNKNLDSNLCRRTIKNVLLMSRDKIHNLYSLDERFHISDGAYKQIEHMRIMNLASNLIINPEIGDERHIASDKMKISEIIEKIMTETHAKIDLILEDPERMCERDVEAKIANTRSGSLIGSIWSSWSDIYRKITNENDIYYKRFQEKPRLLDFYSMKIEMPFSIMNVEFSGTECQFNHVKVDLYSALLHNEDDRRSFIIWQKTDPDNYDFFTNNFDEIMKNSDLCRRVTMLMLQNWDNCWKNISST